MIYRAFHTVTDNRKEIKCADIPTPLNKDENAYILVIMCRKYIDQKATYLTT